MSRIIKPFRKAPPEVKQPHIVSRFLLNRFADDNRYFWKYQRGCPAKRVSTKSQCTQSGYFGVADPHEGAGLETWLSSLETKSAPLIQRLDQETWQLSDVERATLLLFMATLFYRGPKLRSLNSLSSIRQGFEAQVTQENIREHQHRLLQQGTLVEAETLRKKMGDQVDLILGDPAQLQFNDLFARPWKLADLLSRKGFHIVRNRSNAFITSDSPVFPMTIPTNANDPAYVGGGLAGPQVAVFLALSPQSLLVVGPAAETPWNEYPTAEFLNDLQRATIEAADRAVFAFEKVSTLQAHVDKDLGVFVLHLGTRIEKVDTGSPSEPGSHKLPLSSYG